MKQGDPKPQLPPGIKECEVSAIALYYMPNSERRRHLSRVGTIYYDQLRKWEQRQYYLKRHTKNPEIFRELSGRRRAQLLHSSPRWDAVALMRRIYAEGRKRRLEVDHIVPLSSPYVCGLHVWANLQLLAKTENIQKGNRNWPDQWEPVDLCQMPEDNE